VPRACRRRRGGHTNVDDCLPEEDNSPVLRKAEAPLVQEMQIATVQPPAAAPRALLTLPITARTGDRAPELLYGAAVAASIVVGRWWIIQQFDRLAPRIPDARRLGPRAAPGPTSGKAGGRRTCPAVAGGSVSRSHGRVARVTQPTRRCKTQDRVRSRGELRARVGSGLSHPRGWLTDAEDSPPTSRPRIILTRDDHRLGGVCADRRRVLRRPRPGKYVIGEGSVWCGIGGGITGRTGPETALIAPAAANGPDAGICPGGRSGWGSRGWPRLSRSRRHYDSAVALPGRIPWCPRPI
jgi:hypothetical protein